MVSKAKDIKFSFNNKDGYYNESDIEDEEITINDEYLDEQNKINAIPSSNIFNINLTMSNQNLKNTPNNTEDNELQSDSIFIYFMKEDIELPSSIEEKYLNNIANFKREIKELKNQNYILNKNKIKLIDKKNKNNNITKDALDKINSQLTSAKNELSLSIENNKKLQSQIDAYKSEFSTLRAEMSKKSDVINELQKKIIQLEKELDDKKNTIYNEIAQNNINNNKSYDLLQSKFKDIQKKYNESNIELQKLIEENNSLTSALIYDQSPQPDCDPNTIPISKEENDINPPRTPQMNFDSITSPFILPKRLSSSNGKRIDSKKNVFPYTSMNIFPSQKDEVLKESKILQIETELYQLQKQRDKLNDDLSKIPEFPKQKSQINQRRSLELSIEEYNKKINCQKTKLRELNG